MFAGAKRNSTGRPRQSKAGRGFDGVPHWKRRGSSVHEDIYVNDQGVPLNLDKPVFSAVGCDHVAFEWVNDYTLQIHYETTCVISQFTNRWSRPSDLAVGRPNPIELILIRM